MTSLIDFSLIATNVRKAQERYELKTASLAFMPLAIELFEEHLDKEEIEDSITDAYYLQSLSEKQSDTGYDCGIDAITIQEGDTASISLWNFKYTEQREKSDNNFPGAEVDKIISYIHTLYEQDHTPSNNKVLTEKTREIYQYFNNGIPKVSLTLCSNISKKLKQEEEERLRKVLNRYQIELKYILSDEIVEKLTNKNSKAISAKLRAIDDCYFQSSEGDIKALILKIDARDAFRIACDSEDARLCHNPENYENLRHIDLSKDAFEDNVRVYLEQKTNVNKNIKDSATSEENHRFFYYNNGITITCQKMAYPAQMRSPVIEIHNLQIVNGSQTIHALHEAHKINPDKFKKVDLLCRIYETDNKSLSDKIAECTNSQNPVKTRDLRANDQVQKKLEAELLKLNYLYERKRYQHRDIKGHKIDSEKAAQAILAFKQQEPALAKDQKRKVFAEFYDIIFSENINADELLTAYLLFEKIEQKKKSIKSLTLSDEKYFDEHSFASHATYHILFTLSRIASEIGIEKSKENIERIFLEYDSAYEIIRSVISSKKSAPNYTHREFFKSKPSKLFIEKAISEKYSGTSNYITPHSREPLQRSLLD